MKPESESLPPSTAPHVVSLAVNAASLSAAALFAPPTPDVRQYLNGVTLRLTRTAATVWATDGSAALVASLDVDDPRAVHAASGLPEDGTLLITLPLDAIKKLKLRAPPRLASRPPPLEVVRVSFTLPPLSDHAARTAPSKWWGQEVEVTLESPRGKVTCTSIESRDMDFSQFLPARLPTPPLRPTRYQGRYIAAADKAFDLMLGSTGSHASSVWLSAAPGVEGAAPSVKDAPQLPSPLLMLHPHVRAVVVVMPLRAPHPEWSAASLRTALAWTGYAKCQSLDVDPATEAALVAPADSGHSPARTRWGAR